MNGYLVDTNIPSELTRKKPEPAVETFLKQAGRDQVYMSVLHSARSSKALRCYPPADAARIWKRGSKRKYPRGLARVFCQYRHL